MGNAQRVAHGSVPRRHTCKQDGTSHEQYVRITVYFRIKTNSSPSAKLKLTALPLQN